MDNTSSLNEACGSCVPSASLANSTSLANILQKNSSVICVFGLGQTDVAVANMIKSYIQTNYLSCRFFTRSKIVFFHLPFFEIM